eukprot:3847723-Pleurochrysis_carterae.AAC.3
MSLRGQPHSRVPVSLARAGPDVRDAQPVQSVGADSEAHHRLRRQRRCASRRTHSATRMSTGVGSLACLCEHRLHWSGRALALWVACEHACQHDVARAQCAQARDG